MEIDFGLCHQLDLTAIIDGNVDHVFSTDAYFAVDREHGEHLIAPRSITNSDPFALKKTWAAYQDAYGGVVVPLLWRLGREKLKQPYSERIDYLMGVASEVTRLLLPDGAVLH